WWPMVVAVSREELEGQHCWLDHDRVRGDPELTEFRRGVRYHHAMWRQDHGYPIGTHRVRPGTQPRLIGSHLDLDFARESGATFLTTKSRAAAQTRASFVEPHQIFDQQSFWADLLSSEALAVNLFGDLAADLDRADRAVHAWWPATPGRVTEVRFAHSPGRLDPSYSNSRRYFDALFVLELPDGSSGALAIDVKYREVVDRKGVKPTHLPRFVEIHDRSGAFPSGTADVLGPSRLSMIWLEHLLVLSMLQHESGRWTWGRYVVVHPRANTNVSFANDEYRELLADDATFASAAIEELLAAKALAQKTAVALRRRYAL
ncbi:MAG: PGN_0703 family putative restriction endonuclease, partial [Ilumatobacteraceae bacterium]